ncbi:MAG TPA: hypothetical protein DCG53_13290 [Syntrophus sp. (in: bacteria)]|nr:hypothetical protein [Syntrophus sp. (in: bacteria)]
MMDVKPYTRIEGPLYKKNSPKSKYFFAGQIAPPFRRFRNDSEGEHCANYFKNHIAVGEGSGFCNYLP